MLSLRGDPPAKHQPAPPGGYDYEIRSLNIKGPGTIRRGEHKGHRAKEFYLNSGHDSGFLLNRLQAAYTFLDSSTRPGNAVTPAEFHIKARGPLSRADLSLFTKDRMDLHPAVILRALPKGVFFLVAPQVDIEAGDAIWLVANNDLQAKPFNNACTPVAKVAKAKRLVKTKKKHLRTAIETGKITAEGQMTEEFLQERARRKEERKKKLDEERNRIRNQNRIQPNRHDRTERSPEDLHPDWIRELLGPMAGRAEPSNGDQEEPESPGAPKVSSNSNPQHTVVQPPRGS